MNKLRIGICGWGNVATGLFNTIENNNKLINSNGNLDIEIVVIGARRDNPKCDPGATKIERDIFEVINHDIDVLIELIGGVDVARELILKAIKNKKHVVTANKAVLFHHGDEIFKEASSNGVQVLFESSVCAGTPIIKMLTEELSANKVTKISGMLNGTSNFILSNMEEGSDFRSTLELAQKEGYAEPDPTFDIEGMDAAHKIGILSSLAFGTCLPPKDFYIEGISNIEKIDFKYAKDMGFTIKHLAVSKLNKDKVELRAHPVFIKEDSYLANLKSVRNGIEIETDLLGTLHIAGSGAGQESTASGVISDLVNLANSNNNISVVGSNRNIELVDFLSLSFQYYLYIEALDASTAIDSITSTFAEMNIGIELVEQKKAFKGGSLPIVVITDLFAEREYEDLYENLINLDSVNKIRSIRIESN
ncbi:MAG: homoserine dehydrogenase [Gammaproteobacteria bacterium]